MSVQSSRASIANALQDLHNAWLNARGSWDDVVSEEFEKKYLDPMAQEFRAASSAMDQMGLVIANMRRDCTE